MGNNERATNIFIPHKHLHLTYNYLIILSVIALLYYSIYLTLQIFNITSKPHTYKYKHIFKIHVFWMSQTVQNK